jgi:metal-responsive CopG/Arc/MetJ family transcriptional regulator
MKPIQILMDPGLLRDIDREAKRLRSDRSKLIRAAVTSFLEKSHRSALERQHRLGYTKHDQRDDRIEEWEDVQEWPAK